MKLHVLKIKKKYYREVVTGVKTYEIRKDDRGYKVGDIIHFVDVNGNELRNTRFNLYQINYILRNVPQYGLKEGYCILSVFEVFKI